MQNETVADLVLLELAAIERAAWRALAERTAALQLGECFEPEEN
jgi:hypothetical protein